MLTADDRPLPPTVRGRIPIQSSRTHIDVAVGTMSSIRPNASWAMDFQFDTTAGGRTMKMLNVIDELTAQLMASAELATHAASI